MRRGRGTAGGSGARAGSSRGLAATTDPLTRVEDDDGAPAAAAGEAEPTVTLRDSPQPLR